MLIVKIIGCALVVASSAGIGFYFSCVLRARAEELMELKKILILLRGNIRYANTPLAEALNTISLRHKGEIQPFLSWVSQQMDEMQGKTIAEIWRQGVEEQMKGLSLTKKDKEALIGFGNNLGYLDKEMQLGTIDLYVATLEAEIAEITRTMKEKTYLYNSLGFMGGVFLIIILM